MFNTASTYCKGTVVCLNQLVHFTDRNVVGFCESIRHESHKPQNYLNRPLSNTPVSNYASVPANNNLKSRLVLSYARKYSKCVAQLSTSLDFSLLFAGTEANSKLEYYASVPANNNLSRLRAKFSYIW